MDYETGRPNHIEDYLVELKSGCWFTWTDSKNKIYANLTILDGSAKPTEKECTDGLAAMQAAWDLENDSYRSKRRESYDSLANQLDMLYKDMLAGKLDTTGTWATHIKAVKDANPKPS